MFETANFVFLKEILYYCIGLLGVKQDRHALPHNGNRRISGRPAGQRIIRDKAHNPAGKEELPETSRVGKMGTDDLTIQRTLDSKSVQPSDESSLLHFGK
jgi:hypothetical protein